VGLRVYDVLGREVTTLLDAFKDAGAYSVTWDAAVYPSGIYFLRMQAGTFVETKKMLLLR